MNNLDSKGEWSSYVVVVENRDGRVLSKFDFRKLGINPPISLVLARAMRALFGHTSLETQRQVWRCIRKFVFSNEALGFIQGDHISEDALIRFKSWLDAKELSGSTKQSQFNVVVAVLVWCSRNHPETVSRKLRTSTGHFIRGPVKPRRFLEEGEVKNILSACYSDIEAIEKKMQLGRTLLSDGEIDEKHKGLAKLVRELLELGSGRIPTQPIINRSKNAFSRRVNEAGGLRYLNSLVMLSPTDMFPFYLAILIQTSGNPMAIHALNRDCVQPHSFRSDLVLVRWEKPRSASEQKVDFPVGREWSAASLVSRLMLLNANLIDFAERAEQQRLFLAYSHQQARVPCFQMFHHLLSDFISKHKIEADFDFKDLRRAGAKAHLNQTNSIFIVKKRLNHKSIKTTAIYLDQVAVAEADDQIILRFQGELSKQALVPDVGGISDEPPAGKNMVKKPADTIFGFQCKDPFDGVAKGSKKGELCEQFYRCATCPGALIVLDDARVVARLFRAQDELLAAKERSLVEGWWERYETYYLPSLLILENDILPAVSPAIKVKARDLCAAEPLPHLE
jgi:integrase